MHTLCGHVTPISSISLSAELDVCVSGDCSGNICVHTITPGEYIRTIEATKDDVGPCDLLQLVPVGCILSHHWRDLSLVTCIHILILICVHTYMYTYSHVLIQTCTHTYICSYILMLIHIHIFLDDDGWDDDIENDLSLFKLILDYITIGIYA